MADQLGVDRHTVGGSAVHDGCPCVGRRELLAKASLCLLPGQTFDMLALKSGLEPVV
ncbi:hypothetical protein [Azospirillum melinis]|uniref:hypothetical protein n=1 Tax=Azospirillum melinis TaxID=328839 RepID=UPI00157B5EF8|nr:hypothetical protein [Azospirillum melinis]MBP2309714.1 hypothetical protein [Azospirillum melinis]